MPGIISQDLWTTHLVQIGVGYDGVFIEQK
jgi:hypothetical protein